MSSLLLSVAGGVLVGGRSRRATRGAMSTVAGLALIGIAAHRPVADALRRASARRRSATLRLSFEVPHPVGTVFRFCSDFGNFPRFIGALREVHDFGDGRSRWLGWTPTGGALVWDTVTTKFVTNRVIAWQSTPHSPVRTSVTLRFVPTPAGGTSIRIALDYAAVSGSLVEAVAALTVPSRAKELEANIRRLPAQLDLIASTTKPARSSS
ncbi:MAG: SRPBCC family protein [Gemmatimonadaceae bacterium]